KSPKCDRKTVVSFTAPTAASPSVIEPSSARIRGSRQIQLVARLSREVSVDCPAGLVQADCRSVECGRILGVESLQSALRFRLRFLRCQLDCPLGQGRGGRVDRLFGGRGPRTKQFPNGPPQRIDGLLGAFG